MITWSIVYTMVTATFTASHSKVTSGTFLAAVGVCISRVTTPVTGTALFITGGAIQTMTATVVHTVVTKGSAITLFFTQRPCPPCITPFLTLSSHVITYSTVSTMS